MVGGIVVESADTEDVLSESGAGPSLREAFLDAYPVYVAGLLRERGIDLTVVVADAIVEGTAVLDGLLTTLEQTPLHEQRVSPLELFREALRPIDRVLALVDAPEPSDTKRLGVAQWDRYDLSPGSSQVLGSGAHEAHLRWAVTKAAEVAPSVLAPAAFVATTGRSDESILEAVRSVGYRIVSDLSSEATLAVVSSALPGCHELIIRSVGFGVHTVVYGDGLDDLDTTALRALGAAAVVSEAALASRPGDIVPNPA
jgi:hypothetical protein